MRRQCSDQLDMATRKVGLATERADRVVTLTKEDTFADGWNECIQCRRQLLQFNRMGGNSPIHERMELNGLKRN
jgi:hypothetical protein